MGEKMKKLLCCFFLLLMQFDSILAENYIIVNVNDDQIIDAKDEHEVRSIASITKIMTCLIALEYGDFNDVFLVGDEVNSASGSSIYLEKNQQVSMRSLLYGLMLKSGNDAALVIAKKVAGSVEQFVELMNKKAEEIGMVNTVFHNPHGLDVDEKGNYSTAYDMSLLMKEALKNPMFQEIISTQNYTSEWGARWHNSNKLLEDFPFCIGGKTGYTSKAGRTLVTAAQKDGAQYIIVTLNMQERFEFHQAQYQTIMSERENTTLIEADTLEIGNYEVVIDEPFQVVATKEELEQGELLTSLDKEKKEYVVQWYSGNHQKMKIYKAKRKRFCFWRWCF